MVVAILIMQVLVKPTLSTLEIPPSKAITLQKTPYTYRKVAGEIFLNSHLGTWLILNPQEFDHFAHGPIASLDPSLIDKLKKHHFLFDSADEEAREQIGLAYDQKHERISKGPGLFLVGVTRHCNLKCPYCHLSATPAQTPSLKDPSETIEKIVDFILDTPNPNIAIEFQGGEPLLAFKFIKEFVECIKRKNAIVGKGIKFCATSNLTLITEDRIEYLKKEKISLSGTIDGGEELHNANRPFLNDKGSFETVKRKYELLKEKGVDVGLLSIITKKSLGKSREIADTIFGLGKKVLVINKIQKLGRAAEEMHWKEFGISNEEFFSFWTETLEYIFSLHRQGVFVTERYLSIILEKLFSQDPNFLDWRNPGGAILGAIGFDDEGYIYPSDEAREILDLRLGNVFEHNFKDILETPLAKEILKASILEGQICNYCAYKSVCGLCPILSYKNTHEFISRHYQPTNRCSLNMSMFDYVIGKLIQEPATIRAALFANSVIYGKKDLL